MLHITSAPANTAVPNGVRFLVRETGEIFESRDGKWHLACTTNPRLSWRKRLANWIAGDAQRVHDLEIIVVRNRERYLLSALPDHVALTYRAGTWRMAIPYEIAGLHGDLVRVEIDGRALRARGQSRTEEKS